MAFILFIMMYVFVVDTRQRSPSSSKGSRDTYQDRRARSPEPVPRGSVWLIIFVKAV